MNKILVKTSGMESVMRTSGGGVLDWQRWTPYAAVAWSLVYAALGVYWAIGGHGFPYTPETASDMMGPLLGRLGPAVAWIVVILAGMPAAALGAVMLRGVKAFRTFFITTGVLLAGILLLLMTSLNLLTKVGYLPSALLGQLPAEKSQAYFEGWRQWATIHQLLCLVGGFIWLAATVCYSRRSMDACLYCGRREGPEGWTSPDQAARWGHIAVLVGLVAPLFYTFTRYAWVMGFPLGMNEERYRSGQVNGTMMGALSLGTFILVGAVLMLGLVQRWGEIFPRWMIGLTGRRVPIALAVVPASLASVLLIVGGITIWSDIPQMVANVVDTEAADRELIAALLFELGPTLLFPVWGASLAVATLGYYYRRRGACRVCTRGTSYEARNTSSSYQTP